MTVLLLRLLGDSVLKHVEAKNQEKWRQSGQIRRRSRTPVRSPGERERRGKLAQMAAEIIGVV